ncbi:MAG TPA: phosphoribosylamine--glycine ligase, partial [Roseiflexaceae bacterium]|nr:phosphoribosylamine--glycine ligase [Roseiflexaceae bacterium]
MRILLLGADGRAHATTWKLLSDSRVHEVICAPGNGGTAPIAPHVDLDPADVAGIARWCFDEQIDLIVPTESTALRAGLVEEALSLQIGVCGPSQRSMVLEQSRCQAKEFMLRHHLPTAPGRAFNDLATAERYLASQALPVMIKADHPSGGEQIHTDRYAALEGLRTLFAERPLDSTGGVVIETLLSGPRVVMSAFTDGRSAVALLPTRLYNHTQEGDLGPRATAVGAHTGTSQFAQQLASYMQRTFLEPVVAGLARDGIPYWGVLGIDTIITAQGPRLTAIRHGLRPGEAEVVLTRLEDDLLPWLQAMITQRLHELPAPRWEPVASVGIGLFARGFPVSYPYGGLISGLDTLDEGVLAIHHSTANP